MAPASNALAETGVQQQLESAEQCYSMRHGQRGRGSTPAAVCARAAAAVQGRNKATWGCNVTGAGSAWHWQQEQQALEGSQGGSDSGWRAEDPSVVNAVHQLSPQWLHSVPMQLALGHNRCNQCIECSMAGCTRRIADAINGAVPMFACHRIATWCWCSVGTSSLTAHSHAQSSKLHVTTDFHGHGY